MLSRKKSRQLREHGPASPAPARTGWLAALGQWAARLRPAALPLLLAAFVLRIILTYPVFNDVVDEQGHILAGLEFLETGRYEFEAIHPPLGRLAVAALPYTL